MTTKSTKRATELDRRTKLAALKAEQRRKDRRQQALIVGSAILVAAVIAGLVGVSLSNRHHAKPAAIPPLLRPTGTLVHAVATVDPKATVLVPGAVGYFKLSQLHVTGPVDYNVTPPVGGQHNPTWLNCGVYDTPVPNENAVHSMEHGAVWITYQPSLPQSQITALRGYVHGKSYELLTPYPGLPAPVVATAWGVQLRLDSVTDPKLKQFITAYRQGPQAPEPGSPCTGGIGTPVS